MGQETSLFGKTTDELDEIIEKIQFEEQCPGKRAQKSTTSGPLPTVIDKAALLSGWQSGENLDSIALDRIQRCPITNKIYISKELIVPDSMLLPSTNELKIKLRPIYSNAQQQDQQQQYLGLYDNSAFVDELNRIRYEKLDTCWKTKVELKTHWGMHMGEVLKHDSWNDQNVVLQLKKKIEERARLEEANREKTENSTESWTPSGSPTAEQWQPNGTAPAKPSPPAPKKASTNPLELLKKLAGTAQAKKQYSSSYNFGIKYDFEYGDNKVLNPDRLQGVKPNSEIFHHVERDEFDLIHVDLMRLVSNYCETVQIHLESPFAVKELKETIDEETGVITKRMPSIQKFFVQIFDATTEMEICRYNIHVNCYSTEPTLIGMLYRKHQSTNWHYRATNSFKTQMPKTLTVSICEAADLISCDDNGLSDPFVTLQALAEKVKSTEILKRTLQPKWNATFVYLIQQNLKGADATVQLEMLDADTQENTPPRLMGELKLTLAEIFCSANAQFSFSDSQGPQLNCKKWWPLNMGNVSRELKLEQKNRDRKPKVLVQFTLGW